MRRAVAIVLFTLTLFGCGDVPFQSEISVRARAPRPTVVHRARHRLTRAQRAALKRWLAGVAFARWLAALPVPGMQLDSYPREWHPCGGGVYPPCWRVGTESATAGLYRAYNPTGCSGRGCGGKWQVDPRTWDQWAREMGRWDLVGVRPDMASSADQDAVVRHGWANGAGCSHWAAC